MDQKNKWPELMKVSKVHFVFLFIDFEHLFSLLCDLIKIYRLMINIFLLFFLLL